jgi:hypothetical protein
MSPSTVVSANDSSSTTGLQKYGKQWAFVHSWRSAPETIQNTWVCVLGRTFPLAPGLSNHFPGHTNLPTTPKVGGLLSQDSK